MSNVAILGLGAMGARMALRLIEGQHNVVVYNRNPSRAEPLVQKGAQAVATPREAVRDADVIISMVTDDEASKLVWTDPDSGAVGGLRPNAVAIESSTLRPEWVIELGNLVRNANAAFLDAPVAGSRPQADAGQLIYMVGGDKDTLDRVRDLLSLMGGAVHHVGPIGAGATMKLAVNALFGIQVAALAEMVGMLERAGLERESALQLLSGMPITSPALQGVGGLISARKYDPMFPIDLVEKDFGYIVDTARRLDTEAPVASATRNVYAQAREQGFGDNNIAGVAKLYDRAADS